MPSDKDVPADRANRRKEVFLPTPVKGVERILLLGFSPSEAKAWYQVNIIRPLALKTLLMIGATAGTLLAVASPFGAYLESKLMLHLTAEHFILIIVGACLASGLQ